MNRLVGVYCIRNSRFSSRSLLFKIHSELGPGFTEDIYERAMVLELALHSIPFERQRSIPVIYKGQSVGTYRLDLVIDDKIILQRKAVTALSDLFKQQLLSYLKCTWIAMPYLGGLWFRPRRVQMNRQLAA